jgi:hypothetical protein
VPLVSEPVYTRLAVPHPEDGARMLWPEGRDIFGGVALPERNAA